MRYVLLALRCLIFVFLDSVAGASTGGLRGKSVKKFQAQTARDVLDASHEAWCRGDIERLLSCYTDDLVYWCNAGSLEGTPYTVEGKPSYRTFLSSLVSVAEGASVTKYFQFQDGIGRAKIDGYMRHRRTGLVLSGSYRQIVTYRDRKIARLEEYRDAAKLAAFWRLASSEETASSF